MKNAIGYLRCSTAGQVGEDKYGIEAQKEAILSYAHQNGYVIVEWAKDVVSGVSERRPMLDGILYNQDVSNPPYEAVICYKSDRIARDIKLYFYFLFLLERKGVRLISVNEDFDESDPLVNVQRALMVFVAEQERRNIAMRTKAGRNVKRARGGYAGGRCPLGYMVNHGVLVENPSESAVVKMIFEMYEKQKMSLLGIATYLNESGIKTKDDGNWHASTIKKIVSNRKTYEGYIRVGDNWVKGEHQGIL